MITCYKSRAQSPFVIPAQAGIQKPILDARTLDSRLRGNDGRKHGNDWGLRGNDWGLRGNDGREHGHYGFVCGSHS